MPDFLATLFIAPTCNLPESDGKRQGCAGAKRRWRECQRVRLKALRFVTQAVIDIVSPDRHRHPNRHFRESGNSSSQFAA